MTSWCPASPATRCSPERPTAASGCRGSWTRRSEAVDLLSKSAVEFGRLIAAGEVSATEAAQAHLDRISAVDDRVRAFLHVDASGALAAARAVDEARARGAALGPLAGVP